MGARRTFTKEFKEEAVTLVRTFLVRTRYEKSSNTEVSMNQETVVSVVAGDLGKF